MLEDFARRNGLPNPTHFTDDGVSGTCFDRPGFLAMMEEVEAGRVEAIVIKDMSRLGRDYLKVGQVMEILRQRGVRLIAINDGVDSLKGDDDFTPFRNIMNEFYARDTSRKIRSVFKSKGMSGKHLTGTVIYGYLWDEKREHWLVDEEAAEVVRRIFSLTMEGYGPYQISKLLSEAKVEIPAVHLARFQEGVNRTKPVKDPYGWGSSTIVNILKKREYLGHTINFKTRKHFKDKKSHYVDESEWTIFENTHEAIIDQQTFDNVQRIRGNARRYERRKVYHRAWYSLDAYSWTENYALEHGRSPEEILLEREERAARLRLVTALPEALAHATPTQARRIRAYYIAGINQPKIARMEGVHSSKVSIAIRRGLRNMRRCYDGLFPSE